MNNAQCFGLYHDEKIVGFCAVRHFPHPYNKKIKKVHRLVILPDYQGIGLGYKLLNAVADQFSNYDFSITTSARNLIMSLKRKPDWICVEADVKQRNERPHKGLIRLNKTFRANVFKASFYKKVEKV